MAFMRFEQDYRRVRTVVETRFGVTVVGENVLLMPFDQKPNVSLVRVSLVCVRITIAPIARVSSVRRSAKRTSALIVDLLKMLVGFVVVLGFLLTLNYSSRSS
jgi:choline-glycine betaine transporter